LFTHANSCHFFLEVFILDLEGIKVVLPTFRVQHTRDLGLHETHKLLLLHDAALCLFKADVFAILCVRIAISDSLIEPLLQGGVLTDGHGAHVWVKLVICVVIKAFAGRRSVVVWARFPGGWPYTTTSPNF
jgi:hypothetical protein